MIAQKKAFEMEEVQEMIGEVEVVDVGVNIVD